jgi:hypothetical protein
MQSKVLIGVHIVEGIKVCQMAGRSIGKDGNRERGSPETRCVERRLRRSSRSTLYCVQRCGRRQEIPLLEQLHLVAMRMLGNEDPLLAALLLPGCDG